MKGIYDYRHVKSVSAIALLYEGKEAGKIVANWSDNPSGSVCTTCVIIYKGPLKIERHYSVNLMGEIKTLLTHSTTAKAGGGGYCKLSSAIGEAIKEPELCGTGMGSVRSFFESKGYQFIEVI